jgi:hypothetical protein
LAELIASFIRQNQIIKQTKVKELISFLYFLEAALVVKFGIGMKINKYLISIILIFFLISFDYIVFGFKVIISFLKS